MASVGRRKGEGSSVSSGYEGAANSSSILPLVMVLHTYF